MVGALERVAARRGDVVVVKYGGHAMTNADRAREFASDMALLQSLGLKVVVVHGGGPQIAEMLKRLEIESKFVDGLRVTDAATMGVVEMVLCGKLNKQIAGAIAGALGAKELLLLTDVAGVLDGEMKLIPALTTAEAHQLTEDGTATGGMIP